MSSRAECPRITVIVPTRDRDLMIVDCLQSLLALDYPRLEVVVVDQSSTDVTRRAVQEVGTGDYRVRLCPTRSSGVSAARNVGALDSTSEIVAYIDDDCIADPGWPRALAREFGDDDVVAVFGRVLAAGNQRRTGTEVAFKPALGRRKFTARVPPWYVGHGANMAFRRAAMLDAGGFDLLLGAGGTFRSAGDIDLAYRLLASGKCIVYTGAALVYHKQWRGWRERLRTEANYGIGVGALITKHARTGDLYALKLFWMWIWQLGFRRIGAGLLKWRSLLPICLGYYQLVYPWLGVVRSLRRPIDAAQGLSRPYAR